MASATKADIIKKLIDANIEHDPEATKAELEALLPEVASNPEPKGDSVTVQFRGGVRTYSEAVHGEDFQSLANEFIAKHGGEIVKA